VARPRKYVNYAEVHRRHALGEGSRPIARALGISRSVVQRILSGRRPEGGPLRRCDGCEARRRPIAGDDAPLVGRAPPEGAAVRGVPRAAPGEDGVGPSSPSTPCT